MANIIDLTYFQRANQLNIPLSQDAPISNVAMQTPNNQEALQLLINNVEKSILYNSLGTSVYNQLQNALIDIDSYPDFKKLVQGEEYDGKVWEGLDSEDGLIAWRVYQVFCENANTHLSAVGVAQIDIEKGNLISPIHKIAVSNQKFIQKYQSGYCFEPFVYGNFTDWVGTESSVFVSLYQYLNDKKDVLTDLKMENFKTYEIRNSFDL